MQNSKPVSPKVIVGIGIAGVVLLCVLLAACLLAVAIGWFSFQTYQSGSSYSHQTQRSGSEEAVRVGERAHDFSLPSLDGQMINLSDYRGQAVVLSFWATWCSYCLDEFPTIEAYQELYNHQFVVLAVEQGGGSGEVDDFVADNPYPFTFLLDQDYALSEIYDTSAIPATYFIDPQGIIQYIYVGSMELEILKAGLQAIGLE